jgi:uncharacterized protein YceK
MKVRLFCLVLCVGVVCLSGCSSSSGTPESSTASTAAAPAASENSTSAVVPSDTSGQPLRPKDRMQKYMPKGGAK